MKKLILLTPLALILAYTAFQQPWNAAHAASQPATNLTPTRFTQCQDFFYQHTAPQTPETITKGKLRELCFDDFAILHSGNNKAPLFAAEKLSARSLKEAADEKRTDRFYEEARLPSAERGQLADYKGSGFDRGHLAAAAQRTTPEAMAQSFSLANMVPQAPENNRGVWARSVEAATRKYVMRARGDVYVITGTYNAPGNPARFAGEVRIPDALYKLVYDASANKSWVYWTPNSDVEKPEMISYDKLVSLTGIRFLPAMPNH